MYTRFHLSLTFLRYRYGNTYFFFYIWSPYLYTHYRKTRMYSSYGKTTHLFEFKRALKNQIRLVSRAAAEKSYKVRGASA